MKVIALAVALLVVLSVPLLSVPQSVEQDVVLVTGFEPFNRWDRNPSGDIALALNGTTAGSTRVVGVVLPVTFNTSYAQMQDAIERYDPTAVIALGLDGGARSIQVERIAVNMQHPSLWQLSRINASGPMLRGTSLPGRAVIAALHDNGVDARQSWYAGLYACNYVFYRLQGHADRHAMRAGFIHVPPTRSQEPYGMELARMTEAVHTAINVTVAA